MNYSQTIDYLYTRLPMFSRVGSSAIKKDLTNTLRLCSALGDPHMRFRSIHVAGTNGKGSVSHMLAAIYQTAGYKTGLYTSPHLKDFRERIRINGEMISEQAVIDFVEETTDLVESVQPSFFELTVAMAFSLFAQEKVDVAIIETGLGGRLDSTNVILPELSVITNIGHDHADLLGDTPQKIAFEKAGIIKSGIPVIIGEKQEDILPVFQKKAGENSAPLLIASDEWSITENRTEAVHDRLSVQAGRAGHTLSLELDLTGLYQIKNVATVLSAVFTLKNSVWPVSDTDIVKGLSRVKLLTGLQGRWQKLGDKPLIIADTGHNTEGMEEVIRNLARVSYTNLHMVIGMVSDKDHDPVLALLPENARYYFCKPDIPRGFEAEKLRDKAETHGLYGSSYLSVSDAFIDAKKNAGTTDLIFVGGSTFVVAEVV